MKQHISTLLCLMLLLYLFAGCAGRETASPAAAEPAADVPTLEGAATAAEQPAQTDAVPAAEPEEPNEAEALQDPPKDEPGEEEAEEETPAESLHEEAVPIEDEGDYEEPNGAQESNAPAETAASEQSEASTQPEADAETEASAQVPTPTSELPAVRVRFERLIGVPGVDFESGVELAPGENIALYGETETGETVWTRYYGTEYVATPQLLEEIGAWEDRYYFNNAGTIVCLRIADGETIWENLEFVGTGISSVIDTSTGAVYACGWYGPDFFAVDAEGNTHVEYRQLSEDFYWPTDMVFSGPDKLVIFYMGGPFIFNHPGPYDPVPFYVDLTDFSVSFGFALEDLDETRQYWANIFASGFAEQGFTYFDLDSADESDLLEFAYLFCINNRYEDLDIESPYFALRLGTVNEICQRFFGRTLNPTEGAVRTDDGGREWRFENGKYYIPAASGESYNRFAVVRELWSFEDGWAGMTFDVYELNLEEYYDRGIDSALYHLSSEEAAVLAETGRITHVRVLQAKAVPVEQDGHDGYWLIQLKGPG